MKINNFRHFLDQTKIIFVLFSFLLPLTTGLYFITDTTQASASLIQENTDAGSGITSLTFNVSSEPVEDNLLVVVLFTRGSTAPSAGTLPTGWSTAVEVFDSGFSDWLGIYYKVAGASEGTGGYTFSGLTIDSAALWGVEYSGLETTSVLDQVNSSPYSNSTTISSGTTPTTSQADELAIAGFSIRSDEGSSSYSNGFTEEGNAVSTTPAAEVFTAYKNLTSTGTVETTLTKTATSESMGVIATFKEVSSATQIVFTTAARTITAGTCSGAANIITIQLQDGVGTPTNPTSTTVVRISSNSPTTEEIYSDSSCITQLTSGDISFSTAENTKSFYIIDTRKSNPTWTLSAIQQSGPGSLTSDTQSVTVNGGAVTRLVLTLPGQTFTDGPGNSGSPSNRAAGSSFNITSISATDSYNNVNTGYSGSKTLAYSGPGNAPDTTSPTYTTSVSFTSGQSTTALSTTLYKQESTTITVTDSGSYGYASSSVTVDGGTIDNYVVTEAASTIDAGACTNASIQARDSWNNNATTDTSTVNATDNGVSVSFYTNGSCGTGTSAYTLSGGTATAYFSSTSKQASFTVTMTKQSDTPTGTSGNIQVQPAAASALLIQLPGEIFTDGTGISGFANFTGLRTPNATAGTSFSVNIKAVDPYNNLVNSGTNNYTGSKTISWTDSVAGNAPDATSPSFPVGSVTFTNGEADSLTITYYNATSSRTVEADDTVTPVSGTTSNTFTVQASSLFDYGVSAPTPQTAGVAFNVTVTSRDGWENNLGALYSAPAGTYTWSTTATDAPDTTSPNIGTLVQGDFVNGVATKSVTLYKNESGVTFTANEPPASTVTGTSNSVNINVGNISADASDSSVTGGSAGFTDATHIMTITLKDTWRNPVSGVLSSNITLSGTGSPSVVIQPTINTDASGQTTGALVWASGGSYTVSVQISTVLLVQNDGSIPDADGYLDDTHGITITIQPNSSNINGGTKIQGGTTIR